VLVYRLPQLKREFKQKASLGLFSHRKPTNIDPGCREKRGIFR
jgi:hypothetical protein